MQQLFTPWRYRYISSPRSATDPADPACCFLCAAAAGPEDPESLVVDRAAHHLVLLNLHPYANGHLMVAPLAHRASPLDSTAAEAAEFWPLVLRCQRVLQQAYGPDGLNLGANLGQAAGAGVPGHFHFHLVPRWMGDTNFMATLAEVRLIPEDLRQTRDRLRALFGREEG